MAGKRHHYLPGLLLRRFAEVSGERKGLVWRLDKVSGQPRPVSPKYEAALPHYYRLQQPDGTTDSRPEDLDRLARGRRWRFAGLGDALSRVSSVIEGVTFIGFVAFFVWTAAMGVALLRRSGQAAPPKSMAKPTT